VFVQESDDGSSQLGCHFLLALDVSFLRGLRVASAHGVVKDDDVSETGPRVGVDSHCSCFVGLDGELAHVFGQQADQRGSSGPAVHPHHEGDVCTAAAQVGLLEPLENVVVGLFDHIDVSSLHLVRH